MKSFKNTDKAIKRILLAKKRNEKIGIWGDYDPDGIPGAVIIQEALLGAGFKNKLHVILPRLRRFNRSFNEIHLRLLKRRGVTLILGVDFGTSDFDQVRMAKKMGFDVILLDHHPQRPGKLSAILINPLQKGDRYPHKHWSGAGVAYKFFEFFYKERRIDMSALERTLDLVAIAMIADRIEIDKENSRYIDKGVALINRGSRPGLKALLHLADGDHISQSKVMGVFINRFFPRLSNTDNEMYKLFRAPDKKVGLKYAKILNERHEKIQREVRAAVKEGISIYRLEKGPVFVWRKDLPPLAGGMVAAVSEGLVEALKIPIFFYKRQANYLQGSSRAPLGSSFNLVKAMDSCKDLLVSYGGHPTAAGFRLKGGKEKEFKSALRSYFDNL